jgi:hypothetical protein
MDSKFDKCETNLGILCSNSEITSQSHAHAGTNGVSVDGRNSRDIEMADGEKEVVKLHHGLVIGVRTMIVAIF